MSVRYGPIIVPSLALVLFASAGAPAQNGGQNKPTTPAAQEALNEPLPKFEIETRVIDLGVILDSEPAKGTVTFRNAGNAVLSVPQPSTTCGCTAAALLKNDFQPGESYEVEVSFDPRGKHAGKHEQTVTFRTNDRDNPIVGVKVLAVVKPVVAVEPSMVNLGTVAKRTRKETLISLTGMRSDFEVYHVTLVGDGAEFFSIEVLGTETIEADGVHSGRTDLLVSLQEGAPPGRAQALAVIRTNDARRKLITVPLGGEILGDVSLNPARMSLGTVSVGQGLEDTIEIRNGRGDAFRVVGVEWRPLQPAGQPATPIAFVAEPIDPKGENQPAAAYRLKVTMPAFEQAGRVRGNIVVLTDVPLEEQVMLPYVGRVVDNRTGQ